jgi:hypothetical protein
MTDQERSDLANFRRSHRAAWARRYATADRDARRSIDGEIALLARAIWRILGPIWQRDGIVIVRDTQ